MDAPDPQLAARVAALQADGAAAGVFAVTLDAEGRGAGRYSGSQLRTSCATCVAAGGSRLAMTMTT